MEFKNLCCGSLGFVYLGIRQDRKTISKVLLSNLWVQASLIFEREKVLSSCPSGSCQPNLKPCMKKTLREQSRARPLTVKIRVFPILYVRDPATTTEVSTALATRGTKSSCLCERWIKDNLAWREPRESGTPQPQRRLQRKETYHPGYRGGRCSSLVF